MANSIPEATPITLTEEERARLEGLARSTKTEHRLRQRARIVLLAANGTATRAIGRAVGCTTGTASKWRGGGAPRGGGAAGDWRGGGVHDGHRIEVAGALRAEGGSRRDRRAGRRAEIYR